MGNTIFRGCCAGCDREVQVNVGIIPGYQADDEGGTGSDNSRKEAKTATQDGAIMKETGPGEKQIEAGVPLEQQVVESHDKVEMDASLKEQQKEDGPKKIEPVGAEDDESPELNAN